MKPSDSPAFMKAEGTIPCTTKTIIPDELTIFVTAITGQTAPIVIGQEGNWFGLEPVAALQLASDLVEAVQMVPTTPEDRQVEYNAWYEKYGKKFHNAAPPINEN